MRSHLHARMFGEALAVQIGRFVIDEKIGAGAMGVVYAATDPDLDRRVAVKLLVGTHDRGARLMQREARALARLRHPNVVAVHEVGRHEGEPYIAMDLVEGVTLTEWLVSPRPWQAILTVLLQAGAGLAAAHRAGLVHRDFKPDNVLVASGQARVVDFGLARPMVSPSDGDTPSPNATPTTGTDAVAGTPPYMAPEAFAGESDARSDLFSFCATAYEALCGVKPFVGESFDELEQAVAAGRVRAPIRRVPTWLRQRITTGLAASPRDRWDSMESLLAEIHARRRRPYRYALGLTAVGGAILGALAVSATTPAETGRCDGARAAVDAVWSPARQRAVASAVRAIPIPHVPETWRRTRAELDRYAERLAAARVEACRATHERGERSDARFDAHMRCLDRRVDALDTLVEQLEAPDARALARAISAVRGLPDVAACADVRSASQSAEATRPLPRALSRGRSLFALGRYRAARDVASTLTAEALDGDDQRLAAHALALRGHVELRLGRTADAVTTARHSVRCAQRAGDERGRASAQTLLVSALAQTHAYTEALQWVAMTDALIDHLGEPAPLVAGLLAAEGNALRGDGDYPQSAERLRRAVALRAGYLPPDDPLLAAAHLDLGNVLHDAGHYADAYRHMDAALSIRVSLLGEHHPQVAKAHNSLGALLQSEGDLERAAEHTRKAMAVATEAVGPDHVLVGRATANLGAIVAQGDAPTDALAHFRRALQIFKRVDPPMHVDIAATLSNIGRVLAFTGDPAGAVEVLEEASRLYDERLGAAHPDHVFVLNNLSEAYVRQPDAAGALAAATRAVRLGRQALGERHELVASAMVRLGVAQRESARLAESVATLQSAVDTFVELETRGAERALARWELARALDAAGRGPDAVAQMQRALDDFERDAGSPANIVDDARAWLAARR